MTALRRASSDLASMSRAAQRKQRLLEIENEQRVEEAEALKMTDEQREILLRSFTSVKVEFSDLDGLTWTNSALKKRQHVNRSTTTSPSAGTGHAFVILTNADLELLGPDDTIRASAARSVPGFTAHPLLSPKTRASSLSRSHSLLGGRCRNRDGTRERSPIKGLFSAERPDEYHSHPYQRPRTTSEDKYGYESDCDRTVRGDTDTEDGDEPMTAAHWNLLMSGKRGKKRRMTSSPKISRKDSEDTTESPIPPTSVPLVGESTSTSPNLTSANSKSRPAFITYSPYTSPTGPTTTPSPNLPRSSSPCPTSIPFPSLPSGLPVLRPGTTESADPMANGNHTEHTLPLCNGIAGYVAPNHQPGLDAASSASCNNTGKMMCAPALSDPEASDTKAMC